jgi:hypothetical protein
MPKKIAPLIEFSHAAGGAGAFTAAALAVLKRRKK